MAERLARVVCSRDGPKAECLHLDLGKGMKIRPESAARMGAMGRSEDIPARGRRRSRHKARATSEARASEDRPRGSMAIADAVLPIREAHLRQKMVSRGTEDPVRERYPQQRETVGRSAGPWGKDENRRRMLSP